MFKFHTPNSRVVYFHTGKEIALHRFETGEWVISLMIGNQHVEAPCSYLLLSEENPGDPRLPAFDSNLDNLAQKFRTGIGWQSDSNFHRRVYPKVCNLDNPNFAHGEQFSDYCVGLEEYKRKISRD